MFSPVSRTTVSPPSLLYLSFQTSFSHLIVLTSLHVLLFSSVQRIIDDLLDFTKSETGQLHVGLVRHVHLQDKLRRLFAIFKAPMQHANISHQSHWHCIDQHNSNPPLETVLLEFLEQKARMPSDIDPHLLSGPSALYVVPTQPKHRRGSGLASTRINIPTGSPKTQRQLHRVSSIDEHDTLFPVTVVADGARVRQLLLNLIDNAVKFARGYIQLDVWCEKVTEIPNQATVRFDVSDDGCGINPAHLAEIFQPFVQIGDQKPQSFSHSNVSGVGLGLAICVSVE